jgi:hypothetical protein
MTMQLRKFVFLTLMIALVAINGFAASASACKVPVFRFALEHWQPDPYRLIILHRGSLPTELNKLVSDLESRCVQSSASEEDTASRKPGSIANTNPNADTVGDSKTPDNQDDAKVPSASINLRVLRIDVTKTGQLSKLNDELNGELNEALIKELGFSDLAGIESPQMVLLYPRGSEVAPVVWRGPLTSASLASVLDSPVRKQITKYILNGESVVWVLITSGDHKKDDAAYATLQAELARQQKTLKMRDVEVIKGQEEFNSNSHVKLRLGFKLIMLDRNDENEFAFVKMLLRSEPDLESVKGPIAIPILGRGRTCYALAGRGMNPVLIEETNRFLIEDCSCEIKRLNPGMDMLFDVEWDKRIVGTANFDEPLRSPSDAVRVNDAMTAMKNGMSSANDNGNGAATNYQWIWILAGVVGIAVVFVMTTKFVLREKIDGN